MRPYSLRAMIVRQHPVGEADSVISLLSNSRGLVRAYANSARRVRSRFGAKLEPFGIVDISLVPRTSIDTVNTVEIVDTFAVPISSDVDKYTHACTITEIAERLAIEDGLPSEKLFQLTAKAVEAIAYSPRPPQDIIDAFIVRALDACGWSPAFSHCALCGEVAEHKAFHASSGGAVCNSCRPQGASRPQSGALQCMFGLLSGRWDYVAATPTGARRDATTKIEQLLGCAVERKILSMGVAEQYQGGPDGIC